MERGTQFKGDYLGIYEKIKAALEVKKNILLSRLCLSKSVYKDKEVNFMKKTQMVDTGGADKTALSFQKGPWGLFTNPV